MPDDLPHPSAGEQAEGGLQEVLQPQAQRRLALLACQEATVNSLSLKKKEATVNLRRLLLLIFFSLSGDAITAVVYHRSDDTILFRSYFLLFGLMSTLKT